jgi:hypothetical protein
VEPSESYHRAAPPSAPAAAAGGGGPAWGLPVWACFSCSASDASAQLALPCFAPQRPYFSPLGVTPAQAVLRDAAEGEGAALKVVGLLTEEAGEEEDGSEGGSEGEGEGEEESLSSARRSGRRRGEEGRGEEN